MYKIYISLILLVSYSISKAQQTDTIVKAVVHYQLSYIIDTSQRESPEIMEMVLLLNNNNSIYKSKNEIQRDIRYTSLFKRDPGLLQRIKNTIDWAEPCQMFTNTAENKITSLTVLGGIYYYVETPAPALQWDITSQTKTINGYLTQKATTRYKGRNYEAWFCAQLPFINGPWKLQGLPGLILEAKDSRSEWRINFIRFESTGENVQTPFKITNPGFPEKTVSAEDLKRTVSSYRANPDAFMGVTGGMSVGGTAGTSSTKKKQFNNPLEK